MDAPLYQPFGPQVSQYLHSSSPQNFRKRSDMWGFSTPVRSFDDPHCLICPIGHIHRESSLLKTPFAILKFCPRSGRGRWPHTLQNPCFFDPMPKFNWRISGAPKNLDRRNQICKPTKRNRRSSLNFAISLLLRRCLWARIAQNSRVA